MNPNIKVVGVGGSGSNTVSRIARFDVKGIDLVAVNTDAQALHFCRVPTKVLIGKKVTQGLGAGMDIELGRQAAEENRAEITALLKGADMVFITCGLGGGTGSGAGPVIAEISKGMGILTLAVVTTPFSFEGEQRRKVAQAALANLKKNIDSLLVVSNDNLLKIIDEKTTVSNAFSQCDDILKQAVGSITDLVLAPGIINIDFSTVVSIMKDSGQALFGTGAAFGPDRAVKAAHQAINSPLLDFSIKGSKGVLFNVSGNDATLNEIKEAAKVITDSVDPRAHVVFGAIKDHSLKKGEIKITVIATKF
jgi:cell division protein FtsZ